MTIDEARRSIGRQVVVTVDNKSRSGKLKSVYLVGAEGANGADAWEDYIGFVDLTDDWSGSWPIEYIQLKPDDSDEPVDPDNPHNPHDPHVCDLQGAPITVQSLHMLLALIAGGDEVLVRNGRREPADQVMHRLELAYIAAHEARVRAQRNRTVGE